MILELSFLAKLCLWRQGQTWEWLMPSLSCTWVWSASALLGHLWGCKSVSVRVWKWGFKRTLRLWYGRSETGGRVWSHCAKGGTPSKLAVKLVVCLMLIGLHDPGWRVNRTDWFHYTKKERVNQTKTQNLKRVDNNIKIYGWIKVALRTSWFKVWYYRFRLPALGHSECDRSIEEIEWMTLYMYSTHTQINNHNGCMSSLVR